MIGAIVRLLGFQNVIMIEAEREIRENTHAVFKEMLRRGWDKKYRFVLFSEKPETLAHWKSKRICVRQRTRYDSDLKTRLRLTTKKLRAAMIVDENLQTGKYDPKTIHVYLSHGSPAKSLHDNYNCVKDTDYVLCQSDFWKPIDTYEFNVPEERLVIKGFPRNDALFSSRVSMAELFGRDYKKVVVWYPTVRQRRNRWNEKSIAIPVIQDADTAKRINEIAAKYGVLIVVKPHFVQDLAYVQELELDHLKFIDDNYYREHGISAYEFLGQTDALITDYSSVIFDYLLTGKPIGLTWEDFEEYKEKVGFAIDMDMLRPCAEMLDTPEDFERFFRDLTEGNDPHREKREELTRLTNQYIDGNSTTRVVDWLESLLEKRA